MGGLRTVGVTVVTGADDFENALSLLAHQYSPKRRSGAKRLRRMGDPHACAPLLDALQREVRDPRTWETQYQMIMALGECRCKDALPYLRELAQTRFESTMISMALGDAIVRLARTSEDDPTPVLDIMSTNNLSVVTGAYRAVAVLHLKLTDAAVETIIAFVSQLSVNDGTEVWFALNGLHYWVAAAAAGWYGPHVEAFLQRCLVSMHENVREVAVSSLDHEYHRWRPL